MIKEKCGKRINLMKMISSTTWGGNKDVLTIVYKGLIRSVIDYGQELYDSASSALLDILNKIQNQCLRICSGALKSTPIIALENECGIEPLDLRRLFSMCKLYYKYDENHITWKCFTRFHHSKYDLNRNLFAIKFYQSFKPFLLK